MTSKEQDYIDRWAEVATGLELDQLIAEKIANFMHYEIMTARKKAYKLGIEAGRRVGQEEIKEVFKDNGN